MIQRREKECASSKTVIDDGDAGPHISFEVRGVPLDWTSNEPLFLVFLICHVDLVMALFLGVLRIQSESKNSFR